MATKAGEAAKTALNTITIGTAIATGSLTNPSPPTNNDLATEALAGRQEHYEEMDKHSDDSDSGKD